MGERYWISGVQIGMMLAYIDLQIFEELKKLLTEIQEDQQMGRVET